MNKRYAVLKRQLDLVREPEPLLLLLFGQRAKPLPDWLAWECFGEGNGSANFGVFRERLVSLRKKLGHKSSGQPAQIGCIVLAGVSFFPLEDWIPQPKDWPKSNLRPMRYDLAVGEGARVWDDKGKEYLDFVGGLAVNCLGHCHPVVADAIAEQAHTLMQTSLWFYTVPMLRLAELLVKNSCLDRVFICNSGLEANEGAVKLARRYGPSPAIRNSASWQPAEEEPRRRERGG